MRLLLGMMISVGLIAGIISLWATPATAQGQDLDSPKADPAHHRVEFENDRVRVVRWVVPPGDKTALHDHPSLVNVLLTDVNARVTTPDGKNSEIHDKAGSAAWRGPTTHVVENISNKSMEGILVEPKGPGNSAWTPPPLDSVKTDPDTHKVEFENDQVRVVRVQYKPGERSRMHDHPDQVQVWLTDANIRITLPDGQTSEDHPKAGVARWRSAFSHVAENIGDQLFQEISVELKGPPPATTTNK